MQISSNPHAVLFVSPGMGHLIPFLELSRALVDHHNFQATLFVVASDSSVAGSEQILRSPNPEKLRIVSLPPVDLSDVDPSIPVGAKCRISMNKSIPSLRSEIGSIPVRPTVLIVDLFGTEAFSIAEEFNFSKYFFMTTGAWFLAVMLHIPFLDSKARDDHMIRHEPLRLPGCEPIRFEDTCEIFTDPSGVGIAAVEENMSRGMLKSDGILVNSFEDLEPVSLKALRDDSRIFGGSNVVPVLQVGPLVRDVGPTVQENYVLNWLDSQPPKSVVYISFGSGGTLSAQQLKELAFGLELSQQRFVWVVRPPAENVDASYFDVGNKNDKHITPNDYLPDGFMARTKQTGVVVPNWAPQTEILKHPSTGAFISHVGWNSTLESIVNGVPVIAWPFYAEQGMNAAALTEHMEVAVRLRPPSDGVITRDEISKAVRRIMVDDEEGKNIRTRMENLKNNSRKVSSKGGSSYSLLSKFADDCLMNLQKSHGA
ncbi:UDP-glycosyltransferase 72E1-like [Rutidosis leptorrhynchoides]|uniref:UDP-glycosyltransferase 72E1-like n=1 Tax=Rutidosis leptorrhynchoides TaxID=125765 RepID=UPI003A9A27BB